MPRYEDTLRAKPEHVFDDGKTVSDVVDLSVAERDALADALELARSLVNDGEITERGLLLRRLDDATDLQITLARLDALAGEEAT